MSSQQVIPPHIAPDADGTFDSHYYPKGATDTLLAAKADQSSLDATNAALATKLSAADVAGKADKTYVDAQDATKASTASVTAITPGNGQIIIGASPTPIKTLGPVNVKGQSTGAVGDGVTADQEAFRLAGISANGANRIDVPPGTYGMASPGWILRGTPVLHIKGAGVSATVIKPIATFNNIWQASAAYPFEHIIIEDMTFDNNFVSSLNVLNFASGCRRVTVRNCRFINLNSTAIAVQACQRVLIENCDFNGGGATKGTAIVINGVCEEVDIRGCRFDWLMNGITVSGDASTDFRNMIRKVTIEDCRFDGYWWLGKTHYSGSGGTVTYTASGMTDTAASFPAYNASTGDGMNTPYKVTVRAMPVRQTTTTNSFVSGNWTRFSATDGNFITNGVLRGDILRTGTGVWTVVDSVVSATELNVEAWYDANNNPTSAPSSNTAMTIYGVIVGTITSYTSTTLTMVLPWTDRAGNQVTPAAGTLYEIMYDHHNYHLNANQVAADIRVTNNTFRRGWSDQVSLYCARAQVLGNIIEDGEDMGITHNGGVGGVYGQSIIANNRISNQGVGAVYNSAPNTIIAHNAIRGWSIVNPNAGAGFGIDDAGGSNVIIQSNICDGASAPAAKYGIRVAYPADSASVLDNKVLNLASGGADILVYPNTAPTYVTNLHVRGKHTMSHVNSTATNPGGFYELRGSGSPEGAVVAGIGSTWLDLTNGKLYVKGTGTGNTGWVAQA